VSDVPVIDPAAARDPASAAGPSVRRNFRALVSREIVNKAARFLATTILVRSLTLSQFGVVNVVVAAAGIAVMVANLGLSDLGAREVAAFPARAPRFAGLVLSARGITLIPIVVGGLALTAVVDRGALVIVALGALMAIAMALSADWLLRGLERMGTLGNATALGGLVTVAGAILVASTDRSSTTAVAVFAVSELVAAALCWWALRGAVVPRLSLSGVRPLIRRSWPLGLSALAFYTYYANLDTILLGATRSTREAGLYTAAYRVYLAFNTVAIYAGYALLPSLTRRFEGGERDTGAAQLRRSMPYLFCYGALVLGVVEVAGDAVLAGLFGHRLASTWQVFVMLCVGTMWYSVGFPIGYGLIAHGRNRSFLVGSATAAILNVALDVALIPPMGPIGAALATAAAFAIAALVWLGAQSLLRRSTALLIGTMLALTALACVAQLGGSVTRAAGAVTLLAAGGVAATRIWFAR
jgi:O-antigen/teichoic acid export membrane protein